MTAPHRTSQRTVVLVRDQVRETGTLSWGRQDDDYRVELDGPAGRLEASGRDLFDALVALRRRLEPRGWAIAVNGARRDAYPSGMLRDMGGARKVYVLAPGRPARREDLVNTFDDTDPALVGTVEEQERAYDEWRRSVFGDG